MLQRPKLGFFPQLVAHRVTSAFYFFFYVLAAVIIRYTLILTVNASCHRMKPKSNLHIDSTIAPLFLGNLVT